MTRHQLRAWRMTAGLTIYQFAKLIDEHAGSIARAESGLSAISQYVTDSVIRLSAERQIDIPTEEKAIEFIKSHNENSECIKQKTASAEIKKRSATMDSTTTAVPAEKRLEVLREARSANPNLTTRQVAKTTGIGKSTIENYFAGSNMPEAKFLKLRDAYNTLKPEPSRRGRYAKKSGIADHQKKAEEKKAPTNQATVKQPSSKPKAAKKEATAEIIKKTSKPAGSNSVVDEPAKDSNRKGIVLHGEEDTLLKLIKHIDTGIGLMLMGQMAKVENQSDKAKALDTLDRLIAKADCIPEATFNRILGTLEKMIEA